VEEFVIDLSDKRVVITGAAAGIGRACAVAVASRGAKVIINDIDYDEAENVVSEIRSNGGAAIAHGADISGWMAADGLIERCVREFGSITGLINNAALFRMGMVEDLDVRDVTRLWEVNVLGTIACSHHAVRRMLSGGGGSFTYTMAAEMAGKSVRVNAVSPRAETGMRTTSEAFRAAHGLSATAGRPYAPSLNVPVYEYLLSDASKDVNGQVVRMDGLELSLCTHPQVMAPVLTQPAWTAELVDEAFRSTFLAAQAPLGIRAPTPAPPQRCIEGALG
jgi:NAD(P)-dependent dehydrogenase (short-subunit alcohol dehydrogenase family)